MRQISTEIIIAAVKDAAIAREERIPMCQETGVAVLFVALGVHVLMMPCHIASLPLAVNIQCHASRHLEIIL